MTRACRECGVEFEPSKYHPDQLYCSRKCQQKLSIQRWRKANPEKCRQYTIKYKAAHPEKWREISANWNKTHPEKHREHVRRSNKAHPEKGRIRDKRYYAAHAEKLREGHRQKYKNDQFLKFAAALETAAQEIDRDRIA